MMDDTYWKDERVIVTDGASFIGSHLVDKLVELGANVSLGEGLQKSIDWYLKMHTRKEYVDEKVLMER